MLSNLRRAPYERSRESGVTLIELMTVVVVIAILASIAIPSYRRYLIRTQRTEATAALLRLQAAQEKFYLQNNQYAPDVATLGVPNITEQGLYNVSIVPGPGPPYQSYTATAAPVSGKSQQDDTKCQSFTITDTGDRDVTGPDGKAACWR